MTDNKLIGTIGKVESIHGVIEDNSSLIGSIKNKSEINVTVTSIGSNTIPYVHPEIHPASIIEESEDRMFVTQQEKIKIQYLNETYTHDQMIPSSEWHIYHQLGKYPSVTVVDSSESVVLGEIQYLNQNEVILRFMSEFSGIAYLN